MTGQILDADIIFDADFIRSWTKQLELEKSAAGFDLFGAVADAAKPRDVSTRSPLGPMFGRESDTDVLGQQFSFGAMALTAAKPATKAQIEKLLVEGVKSVVTHEVGHTLGLRHNFKASSLLTMEEINDPEKNRTIGLAASVMDYLPVNVAPKGKKQGDYFMRSIGPYDYWAIEYGYKPLPGGTEHEVAALEKLASRCNEPALRYATDEDIGPLEPDPTRQSLRSEQGSDGICPLAAGVDWPDCCRDWSIASSSRARTTTASARPLPSSVHEHDRAMGFVAREIGGIYVNRNHKGDPNGAAAVDRDRAEEAAASPEVLEKRVFGPEAYQFPTSSTITSARRTGGIGE